ncbi:MAG: START domain-containing protein [Myxococcota bacterium]|nr:START domain-containing protein [Myxococcota bacterium]
MLQLDMVFVVTVLSLCLTTPNNAAELTPQPAQTVHAQSHDGWISIKKENGIQVWKKSLPNNSTMTFRGRLKLPYSINRVFAVLYDHQYKVDWLYMSTEYRLHQRHSRDKFTVYNRIASPSFMVSDREMYLQNQVVFRPNQNSILIRFRSTVPKNIPVANGCIRIPNSSGQWHLQALSENSTEIVFETTADPGGWVPSWVANIGSEDAPWETLKSLRNQLAKKVYQPGLKQVNSDFDWSGFSALRH